MSSASILLGVAFSLRAKFRSALSATGMSVCVVVEGDLLGLRAVNPQHANDLAMRGDAVRAHVGGGADQEDVLLLPPLERTFPHHGPADQAELRFDQVGPQGLCAKEVRQKAEGLSDGLEGRKRLFVDAATLDVAHVAPTIPLRKRIFRAVRPV